MPATTYLLITDKPELLRAWWIMVPEGRGVLTAAELTARGQVLDGAMRYVLVCDAALDVGEWLTKCEGPVVLVGDESQARFQQMRNHARTRVCMGYEQSRARLGEFLPLLEEIASHEMFAAMRSVRDARKPLAPQRSLPPMTTPAGETWEFFSQTLDAMGDRPAVLAEFRRAARVQLRASCAVFFFREEGGFRPDQGEGSCTLDDPLIQFLTTHPAVLDGENWPVEPAPQVELAARHRFMLWGTRLLVPIHEQGRLYGFISLGVREDGLAYDDEAKRQAVLFARLLRQCLMQASRSLVEHPNKNAGYVDAEQKHGLCILASGEFPPKGTPTAVRALVAEARKQGGTKILAPSADQPWRASCGMIADSTSVWLYWGDAADEQAETLKQQRSERLELLRELALTLNHELGNSLVSLAALRHNPGAETNSPVLLAAIKRDIASLELLNRHLAAIPTFNEVAAEEIDIRTMLHAVGRKTAVTIETGPREVILSVAPRLVEFGLEAIVASLVENRPGWGKANLTLQLRTPSPAGAGAQIVIRGPDLVLEGIMPIPEEGAPPMHGRIGVFIAKEVIRLHGGSIETSNAIGGPEIVLTLKKW